MNSLTSFRSGRKILVALALLLGTAGWVTGALSRPPAEKFVPEVIDPGSSDRAPSDAIVLFDGGDLSSEWKWDPGRKNPGWDVEDGVLTVRPGSGSLTTKRAFGDIQLHLEWRSPESARDKKGESSGNSGIKFHEAYEIQILNSYRNTSNPMGQAAAVYKQHPPMVNACRAPGDWQTYDIIFRAPHFDEAGKLVKKGTFTVFHNGVLVHEVAEIQGRTNSNKPARPEYRQPFFLQDHGSRVSFRNIWVRELPRKPL